LKGLDAGPLIEDGVEQRDGVVQPKQWRSETDITASSDKPIACSVCEATFAVVALPETDYQLLQDLLDLEQLTAERSPLLQFRALCERYPILEKLIRPKAEPVPLQAPLSVDLQQQIDEELTAEESKVLDTLGRYYTYPLRLRFVREKIDEISERVAGKTVMCPRCNRGVLYLDPTQWEAPSVISTFVSDC
jgi:hypothetical protein